ncbi:cytochrome P450 [Favolaschia claudopus]|uniref:Cytochrome P450 n=1 Tax=Favolaschia claudopus TaxID=2862362 RepID=A0AAW0CBB1_9AGAR
MALSKDLGSIVLIFALALIGWRYRRKWTKRIPRLPPGPPGLPLVGNLFDAPTNRHWLKFAEMGQVWGDISSLTVLGQITIILNSVEAAEDILDARGANFSDRPVIPMGGELCGFNNALILSQYGERVRTERKLFHHLFGTPAATTNFAPLIATEIGAFLHNVASNPQGLIPSIRRLTAAITLRIAYGYRLRDGSERDSFLQMFETAGQNFSRSAAPGAFLVDTIPSLRIWPNWLPGGGFHTTAKDWSKQLHDTVNSGLAYVKAQMIAGKGETSFVSTLLDEKIHDEYLIKWAGISIEEGGSDTTAAQLEAFFLAMSLYPDVQAAAQEELDRVVGFDRLADLSDRGDLPYMNALVKEVFRWHNASPIGLPHRAREDCIYQKDAESELLLIPKNSLVIANIWKLTHDPKRYANPMRFNPSRFIAGAEKEAEPDPTRICFGYGRRICPGKHLADTILYLACTAVLSVFKISKAKEGEPQLGQASGTVSHPLPFDCVVEPRNAAALALIRSTETQD